MLRNQPINSILPSSLPEYISVDYLADDERTIDPLRNARLQRFLNEPLSRNIDTISNISSLTSADYLPNAPSNTEISSLVSSKSKSLDYGNVYQEPLNKSVINPEYEEPIQFSEMGLINNEPSTGGGRLINLEEPSTGGGGIRNFEEKKRAEKATEEKKRGDGFQTARVVRQSGQLAQRTGQEVSLEDLRNHRYGFTDTGNRRTAPTIEQRIRLYNAGTPYRGDEDGVYRGRKPKK
jgi:hypothetical protein